MYTICDFKALSTMKTKFFSRFFSKLTAGAAFFSLTSCGPACSMLTVRTDYVSHEQLASYYVHTPDPRLNNPSIGQRLIVSWSIPKKLLKSREVHLEMTLRFRTREECTKIIPISRKSGTYVYALMNEDYARTKGILTYKIDLIADNALIEQWRHQIWTELILIEHGSPSAAMPEKACAEFNRDLNADFEEL